MLSTRLIRSLTTAFVLIGVSVADASEPIRVMSFNIRFGTANDGDNVWANRKDFVAETILAFDPDLLGTQETLAFQRDDLSERLPGYATFGVGRTDGKEDGEMMSIFYRTSRFEKLDGGHFWLSQTPDVVGSISWESSLPRMASWLKLRDKTNDEIVWHFNTHFDHRSPHARLKSAELIRSKVASMTGDHQAIVTGDFNADADSVPYHAMFNSDQPAVLLVDTYAAKHPDSQEPSGTSTRFEMETRRDVRIDWIAITPDWIIESADIDTTNRDGRTPSDHLPVTAVVNIDE